jgi:hypothetical protein
MARTWQSLLIAVVLISLLSEPVHSQNLSGLDIANKVKAALEHSVPSPRILTISIKQESKRTAQWTGAQAHALAT